jgi:hypothetical protein
MTFELLCQCVKSVMQPSLCGGCDEGLGAWGYCGACHHSRDAQVPMPVTSRGRFEEFRGALLRFHSQMLSNKPTSKKFILEICSDNVSNAT